MAEKDNTEKVLMDFPDVFADIVNVLLFNGKRIVIPEELTDMQTRGNYVSEGVLRELERDVAKRWESGGIRIACLGIENQTDSDSHMVLRVYGYDGVAYQLQCLKENRSKPTYPVVTLVLYFGHKKHWSGAKTLYEAVDVREELKPYVTDMKMNLFEIAYLTDEQVDMFESDFKVVADYFVQMRKNGEYKPSKEKMEHVKAVLQLLGAMEKDQRFGWMENIEDVDESEVENMCEWLDKVEEKNKSERSLEIAKALIEMGKNTLEEIAQATKLPLERSRSLPG